MSRVRRFVACRVHVLECRINAESSVKDRSDTKRGVRIAAIVYRDQPTTPTALLSLRSLQMGLLARKFLGASPKPCLNCILWPS
jgi:hypothetical protein